MIRLKSFTALLAVVCMILFSGCSGHSESDTVQDFAIRFGELAQQGNLSAIRDVCPEAANATAVALSFNPEKVEIFPEDEHEYTIKYGNGASIRIRVGLSDAVEVINTTGILTLSGEAPGAKVAKAETVKAAPAEPSKEEMKAFAKRLKANVVAGNWTDAGWNDADNCGTCVVSVKNRNSFAIDAADYYITYKYEYLYGEGMMTPENVRKNGKTIAANGSAQFRHHYTDDCGPTIVTVHFNLSDEQLYKKYSTK